MDLFKAARGRLTTVRTMDESPMPYLLPDGKTQVTGGYGEDGLPKTIETVVVSTQHLPDVTQEQVKAQIEDFSQSYEDPKEVLKYYYSDRRRLAEVEALVLEENVVNYVLGKAKTTSKSVAFDELMGNNAQA